MEKISLGLQENWKQFTLLVIINAFVGGMIGLERSILPQIAELEFGIAAKSAILSFIIVFGIVKAVSYYFAGTFANKVGRRNLLTIRWVFGTVDYWKNGGSVFQKSITFHRHDFTRYCIIDFSMGY